MVHSTFVINEEIFAFSWYLSKRFTIFYFNNNDRRPRKQKISFIGHNHI